ncbi:hypothetical protein BD410DRAFT_783197 [Rickenella mellea]|uniref:Uncharacterized protein n=1 Tax=Rickenella mellea TaxID=50990 RepID=A0A4Y7QH99_9AGAM|nr:hypothetical protein BD410DRAFT_783197 [Rickenella mellea]
MATSEKVAVVSDNMPDSPSPSILTNGDRCSTCSVRSSLAGINPPVWTHRVSASFNAMADQIAAASQAIALIPPLPDSMFGALSERIEGLERTQERLEAELKALREQMTQTKEGPEEKFEKRLDELAEAFKLDQKRLPARLYNATVTVNKHAIKPIVMANGKFPQNFPATKGEFEHITKERYEFLQKSYGLPITGDTAAKREAVRAFIGLPQ